MIVPILLSVLLLQFDSPRTQFDEAMRAFEEAADVSAPEERRARFESSAAMFDEAAREVDDATIWFNAGNAWLLSQDLGRAVARYRRARSMTPWDDRVQVALDHARSFVEVDVREGARSTMSELWIVFRAHLPRRTLFWIFVASYVCAWAGAIARQFGIAGRSPMVISGAIAIGSIVPLGIEHLWRPDLDDAVVLEPTIGRAGPHESLYEASFELPLGSGLEVRAKESRSGWHRIELTDGRETWVPSTSLEWVWPDLRSTD